MTDGEAPKLKPFAIMSNEQFRVSKMASLSPDTQSEWRLIGTLQLENSSLHVTDPLQMNFSNEKWGGDTLNTPTSGAVKVFLNCLVAPGRRTYISAIKILFEDLIPTQQQPHNLCTPVDSGRILISDSRRLRKVWQIDDLISVDILVRLFEREDLYHSANRALAEFKKMEGVEFEKIDDDCFSFLGFMTDAEFIIAKRIEAESNGVARIKVVPHSMEEFDEQLKTSPIGVLYDSDGIACAFMFQSGFGDGMYYWESLIAEQRRAGYFCDLLGEKKDHPTK